MASAPGLLSDLRRRWRARFGVSFAMAWCGAWLGLSCNDSTVELFAPSSSGGTSTVAEDDGTIGTGGPGDPASGGAAGRQGPGSGGRPGDDGLQLGTGGTSSLFSEDGVCGEFTRCPAGQVCKDGRCQACFSSGDCAGGETCLAPLGVCVPKCESDHDCDYPFDVCRVSDGQCVECERSAQCDTLIRPVCNVGDGRCECTGATDCPQTEPICDYARRKCVCYDDAHCASNPEAPHCLDGECVQCSTNAHCASNPEAPNCFDGACVECTQSQHCYNNSARPFCDNFKCVECSEVLPCGSGVCDLTTNLCSE